MTSLVSKDGSTTRLHKADMPVADIFLENKEGLCYNGNPRLKKANVNIPYTQEQIDEFIKCQMDIVYFIKNYVKIVSLDHGLVLFDLFDYQEDMLTAFTTERFVTCLTARQMGKTTTVAAYLLHKAIFTKDLHFGILANKGDTAREILARIKEMFEWLPWFLKPGVVEWNKGSIEFSNGSKMLSAACGSGSIRGRSMNVIYLDEFAHVENDVEFYTGTYPVISAGETTQVIVTSTPNGMNLFYKIWSDAKNKRNEFFPVEVLWDRHPKRTQEWRDTTLRNISQKQFDQEFACQFHGSSDTLISGQKLQQLAFIDPIEESNDYRYKVYIHPVEGRSYATTVDVAEGIGKDYSVISTFDITETPYRLCSVYRNNIIPPLMLSDIAYQIAKKYNDSYLIIESNTVGKIVAENIHYELEYDNMLTTVAKGSENSISSMRGEIGIRTTKKTKLLGCSALKSLVESDTLLIEDFDAIAELSSFIKKGTSYEAEPNKTDDIVMTMVIFAWFTSQSFFADVTNANVQQTIRDNFLKLEDQNHLIFGFYDDGTDKYQDSPALF